MKKIALRISLLCLTAVFIISCGSTKKGCGLTSDAKKIEAPTSIEYETIVAK